MSSNLIDKDVKETLVQFGYNVPIRRLKAEISKTSLLSMENVRFHVTDNNCNDLKETILTAIQLCELKEGLNEHNTNSTVYAITGLQLKVGDFKIEVKVELTSRYPFEAPQIVMELNENNSKWLNSETAILVFPNVEWRVQHTIESYFEEITLISSLESSDINNTMILNKVHEKSDIPEEQKVMLAALKVDQAERDASLHELKRVTEVWKEKIKKQTKSKKQNMKRNKQERYF